jgi:hypothetical protein
MSEATETLVQARARNRGELEARYLQIVEALPNDADDWEDARRGQLAGLLFALGMHWMEAHKAAIKVWDESRPIRTAESFDSPLFER